MSLTKVTYAMIDGAPINVLDYGVSTIATAAVNTAAFQAAMDTGLSIYIPPGTYSINDVLYPKASVFGYGAKLVKADQEKSALYLEDLSNVTVAGLEIDGSWSGATAAEGYCGIEVIRCENVIITDCNIYDQYGDCVYIGSASTSSVSQHVIVQNSYLGDCRRCNVAVVAGADIRIINNDIYKALPYVSSIDLEPNVNAIDYVRDITIEGNRFDVNDLAIISTNNNGSDQSGIRIIANTIRARYGVNIGSSSDFQDVVVADNKFESYDATYGKFLLVYNVDNLVIAGNTENVLSTDDSYNYSVIEDCTNVSVTGNGFYGTMDKYRRVIAFVACTNVSITGNTFKDVVDSATKSSAYGSLQIGSTSSNFTVTGNSFQSLNENGIYINDPITNISIEGNSFISEKSGICIADNDAKIWIGDSNTFDGSLADGIVNANDQYRNSPASGGVTVTYNDRIPPGATYGTYAKGSIIWNTNPSAGGFAGWICVTAGNPGTWKTFGVISV